MLSSSTGRETRICNKHDAGWCSVLQGSVESDTFNVAEQAFSSIEKSREKVQMPIEKLDKGYARTTEPGDILQTFKDCFPLSQGLGAQKRALAIIHLTKILKHSKRNRCLKAVSLKVLPSYHGSDERRDENAQKTLSGASKGRAGYA